MSYSHCRICGRPLTDPDSVAAGIGPICNEKGEFIMDGNDLFISDSFDLPFDEQAGDIICRRDPGGAKRFNFNHSIKRHSPSGLEWGYMGSGPADFALNALLMFTTREIAERLHQNFKAEFVAALSADGGTIKGVVIRAWIKLNNSSLQ